MHVENLGSLLVFVLYGYKEHQPTIVWLKCTHRFAVPIYSSTQNPNSEQPSLKNADLTLGVVKVIDQCIHEKRSRKREHSSLVFHTALACLGGLPHKGNELLHSHVSHNGRGPRVAYVEVLWRTQAVISLATASRVLWNRHRPL